ncbi:MAG: isoleucine--tRNA ligase [Candidatus Margulisbacteria bacterium]|nr:isoleucine--tRNA ligase [Candidatus Margulisiibacteriota bacterium]
MASENTYKNTLNLPQTPFPIRAGLATREPELLEWWKTHKLGAKIEEKQKNCTDTFLLHDGPPYPNGDIHMGHALNKILKDIIVRFHTMSGRKSPFIPGWDCHGLPIETQLIKQLKKEGKADAKSDIVWFREQCKTFALNFVETQKQEFLRLGITGQFEKPYLTLTPSYEASVITQFGKMADNGLIYQGRKPIHWCPSCQTALAEAEIEYDTHRSPSIYVTFDIKTPSPTLQKIIEGPASILVWTTTPWTLPANVALAAHPDFDYLVGKHNNQTYIFVKDLKSTLLEKFGWESFEELGTLKGSDLLETMTQHPFINRHSPLVTADYVTQEDGTGFVHIAPGHGQDDYLVGQKHNLPTIMPVDDEGKFTDEVPWSGMSVFDANKEIGLELENNGHLLKLEFIKHSYPHCWRCKNPVIFRATEQWFVAMDTPMKDKTTLRQKALDTIKSTKWVPDWGEKRIRNMIEGRPDWCISRQRSWGIPIPVFICTACNHPEMTGIFNESAVKLIQEKGTLAWFTTDVQNILPKEATCSKCGAHSFEKETDILDVWFESGASFSAVLNDPLPFPADLYLEGSDQHRGWFQSSLLIGLGAENQSPFRSVLTHGFIVDQNGKKMSKSIGNVISPLKVIKESGADILRWWVASTDFKTDVTVSQDILKQSRDSFSKVRNTLRFLMSNLYDFDQEKDRIPFENLSEIDRWILLKCNALVKEVTSAFETYDFHIITHRIHDFCAVTLSALYLDMVKDRLYCGTTDGHDRRSTQTALHHCFDTLSRLLAPIMVFTSEDAAICFETHSVIPSDIKNSIHLSSLPNFDPSLQDDLLEAKWKQILDIRDRVYQELEKKRQEKVIQRFLEADVCLSLTAPFEYDDWASVLMVGSVTILEGSTLSMTITKTKEEKCDRCWRHLSLEDGLCDRCKTAITNLPKNIQEVTS